MRIQRHWTEKKREEMSERDWRIFREDFSIGYRGSNIVLPIRNWDEAELPKPIQQARGAGLSFALLMCCSGLFGCVAACYGHCGGICCFLQCFGSPGMPQRAIFCTTCCMVSSRLLKRLQYALTLIALMIVQLPGGGGDAPTGK